MCLNSLFGFSDSSAISFEHIKQIVFPNMSETPILHKNINPLIVSASYMIVSLAYNSVLLRGVTRLDGAQGKKQVWRLHIRI